MDIKVSNISIGGLHKSAIIYRDDSACYIYVCFHCGLMLNECNEILLHIESHFQSPIPDVQFIADPAAAPENVEIKVEVLDQVDPLNATSKVDWSTYDPMDLQRDTQIKKDNKPTSSLAVLPFSSVKRQSKETPKRVYSRPYRCHKCHLKYGCMNALRAHFQKTHADDDLLKIFRCKECDTFHRNPYELRIHVLQVHRMIEQFNCNACSQRFMCSLSELFEDHLEQHNKGNKLWMDIRDGIDHPDDDYSQYEEFNSFPEEQHSCEFCTQRFHLKSNLDEHVKGFHYGQRRLQCRQCESVFTAPKYYFAHQLEHQRVGQTILERDDNVLLANLDACINERIVYDKTESNEQTFRCLICNIVFHTQYEIRGHIRERHVYKMLPPPMEPRKEFICDFCVTGFKRKGALKNHLMIHTNTKSYACSICGKRFRLNGDRRIHERQHTGEKPFICHQCGKGFISKGLLTAHQRCHDDTTYPCPICGRQFNLPSTYNRHIKTHNKERSFQCTVCTKSFTTRIYLTRHMAIHSNKEYQCQFCECKYNTNDKLRQHQRQKHKFSL